MRLATPSVLVDLLRTRQADAIELQDGVLRVGALVRQRAAERSGAVAEHSPLLAEALPSIGHRTIRNRGTIGGSLAHADPAAELPAVAVALGAHVETQSGSGSRTIPATELFVMPLVTVLAPDELIVAVHLPVHRPRSGSAWLELSRRHGDFALAGVAAVVDVDAEGGPVSARLALAGVGPTPVAVDVPGDAVLESGARAAEACRPAGDVHASADYRRRLVRVLADRAVERALGRARAA
jgi:CO/xanthine dehydrogenase FAD-binding subunit